MKLLINTSTLYSTGVTQVATSFINECKKFPQNFYIILLSNTVAKQLNIYDFPDNFKFYILNRQIFNPFKGFNSFLKLKKIENQYSPNCVFSIFGPSYWTPKVPHLQGYAYPHYIYIESPLYDKLGLFKKSFISFKSRIHKYFLNKNGKYFVCETFDVSKKVSKFLNISPRNIFTVSNTCNNYFNEFHPNIINPILKPRIKNERRLLILCSFTPHKNILILNELIPLLKTFKSKFEFHFILTIDDISYKKYFNEDIKCNITNLGRIKVSQCPQLYYETDVLFLPTLMECFSANYVEAMKMSKPILTSNLSFATSVCGDSALYFNPNNIENIASKIIQLFTNENLYLQLVENGKNRLKYFPNAFERAEKYLEICNEIIK